MTLNLASMEGVVDLIGYEHQPTNHARAWCMIVLLIVLQHQS